MLIEYKLVKYGELGRRIEGNQTLPFGYPALASVSIFEEAIAEFNNAFLSTEPRV